MIFRFTNEREEYIKKEESYKNKIKELENNISKYNVDKLKSDKISNSKSTSVELSECVDIFKTNNLDKNKKKRKNNQNLSLESNIFNHRLLNFNYNSELSSNNSINLQGSTILSPQLKVKSVDRSNRIKSTPYNKFNTFICPHCPDKKEFTSKNIYKNHIDIHKNYELFKKISPTLKCDECLLTFNTSRAKSIHNTKYH